MSGKWPPNKEQRTENTRCALKWTEGIHGIADDEDLCASVPAENPSFIGAVDLEIRQMLIKNAPPDFSEDEREKWWISKVIGMREEAADSVPDLSLERALQARIFLHKRQILAITECKEALGRLRHHLFCDGIELNPPSNAFGPRLWSVTEPTVGDTENALCFLEALVESLELNTTAPVKPGNRPSKRSIYVRMFWPNLERQGYSMRSAARLLSAVFMKKGLESEDTSETIYQAIRNLRW